MRSALRQLFCKTRVQKQPPPDYDGSCCCFWAANLSHEITLTPPIAYLLRLEQIINVDGIVCKVDNNDAVLLLLRGPWSAPVLWTWTLRYNSSPSRCRRFSNKSLPTPFLIAIDVRGPFSSNGRALTFGRQICHPHADNLSLPRRISVCQSMNLSTAVNSSLLAN